MNFTTDPANIYNLSIALGEALYESLKNPGITRTTRLSAISPNLTLGHSVLGPGCVFLLFTHFSL
jgi:hypothetical protein